MDRRRNKKHSNNWNNQKRPEQQREAKKFVFNRALYEDQEAERQRNAAIQNVKSREIICPKYSIIFFIITTCSL